MSPRDDLKTKIQSISEHIGATFERPSNDKVDTFCKNLEQSSRAKDYLQITRGLNPETISNFRLGYDPEKDAISIPVYKRGELINIRYRFIDPQERQQKYTQERGAEVWLYNEDGIAKGQAKGGVLVVEGEFDLMSCWQAGIKNVVSPASGKDSYGRWLELLDTIPKVYISYDNDKPGKKAAMQFAERIGVDKCYEVLYPHDVKDANEFFKEHTIEEYRTIITNARPFYKYQFAGVPEIIESLKSSDSKLLRLKSLPFIELEDDWMIVVSGTSNVGKTSYCMNISKELVDKGIPNLVMPFERGIKTVGKRLLQVIYNKKQEEFENFSDSEWDELSRNSVNLPIYFSLPHRDEIKDIVVKAKRLFGVRVVIIDHLNYLVRKTNNNENTETANALQEFKALGQEHGIIFIIVHHINKPQGYGNLPKKPKMEDLKGSSSAYQDPEAVVMLNSPEHGKIEVDVVKNKGAMGSKVFDFDVGTGVLGEETKLSDPLDEF